MDAIGDFLELLDRHCVRHVTIGGRAFVYHAKPRFPRTSNARVLRLVLERRRRRE